MADTYLTVARNGEAMYKAKGSKHLGLAFEVSSEDQVKHILDGLRKAHHNATHVCYAWRLGTDNQRHRANDDGEPSGTAGLPIMGRIKSAGLTYVLVAVVRWYGGTKLGTSGLIEAYGTAARLALETAGAAERRVFVCYSIRFAAKVLPTILTFLKKEGALVSASDYGLVCFLKVGVSPSRCEVVEQAGFGAGAGAVEAVRLGTQEHSSELKRTC